MGYGNIDVGNRTATRKPGQPLVESLSGSNGSTELRIDSSPNTERRCGAMLQQGDEFHGNVSAPQGFLRLVGCREPKAIGDHEVRRYPNPVKR